MSFVSMISNISSALFIMLILMTGKCRPYYDDYFLPVADPKTNEIPSQYDEVQDEEKPTGFTCGLCLVVDEEFSVAYNIKDENALKSSMSKIVDHASWVFRSADWNNDGQPDNIGFKIVQISFGWKPFKKETERHYSTPKGALELLKIFSRLNFNKCCLGVGFTNRPFQNGLDGISFGASDRLIGGICDHRNPREDFMTNMNTILISGRGKNRTQSSSFQIARTLLHELGHAFGVHAHDNDYRDPECWGFRPEEDPTKLNARPIDGRYIMWNKGKKHSNSGLTNNSLKFSSCSKYAINGVIKKRRNRQKCFELDFNPFCGNGIIEGVELCDCGTEFDCSRQKCCGSRKSEKPCMIQELKSCSPSIISRVGAKSNDTSSSSSIKLPNFIGCSIALNLYFIFTTAINKFVRN